MARSYKKKTNQTYKRTAPYDPRVDMFKQFYMRPDSYTFMNVRQSSLRAGYTEQYANNLSTNNGPKWYLELIESADYKRARMLQAAENNLLDTIEKPETGDTTDKKLKHDATKFVSERLGKEHYSTRTELTDADGRKLFTNNTKDGADIALDELFVGVSADRTPDKAE